MKITAKQQYWMDHIKKAKASGLSYSDYARQENIALKALYNWNSLLAKKGLIVTTKQKSSAFINVKPTATEAVPTKSSNSSLSKIDVVLPNGVVVRCQELSQEILKFLVTL